MKTFVYTLLSILMTFLPSTLHAAQYYIYNMDGSVERLENGQWRPVKKNEKTVAQDKYFLKEGAMLAIGDKETHRVYITRQAGVQNVAQIILNARQQSSQTTRLALQKAIEASCEQNKRSPAIMGVSYRNETDLAEDFHIRLYVSIRQYLKKPKRSKSPQMLLTRVKEGGYCYFHVENHTDQLLYFNILAVPENEEKAYICLDTGEATSEDLPVVAPHSNLTLQQFPFIDEDASCRYLLFALPEPFDAQTINSLIKQQSASPKGVKTLPLHYYLL
ncbi:MAG: hypothetical protein J5616_04180 [Bacteroidaceae bacterium]|nr:hypothetical protein [Bacteroidaceae bacterium]